MKTLTDKYLPLLTVMILSLMVFSTASAENLQKPQQIIQNVSDTLQKKLQDESFNRNFRQVVQFVSGVILPHTDFDKIAPLVLGKHWKSASGDEQARFKTEFQTLIIRAYARAFVEYNDWKLEYIPLEIPPGTAKVLVKTKVLQPRLSPVEVYYRMYDNGGHWKVYDILIDGVSLITTYRSTLSDDIQRKGSLRAVIDDLAKRNVDALKAN